MTREEAIEEIKRWTPILLNSGQCTEKTSEAQDMAISALSVPEGEYINKSVVLTEMDKRHAEGDFITKGFINSLPTISVPKREKGEWIKVQSGDKDFPESIVCSKCKNENSHFDFNEHAEPIGKVFVTSNFCPNCGADMREPKGEKWDCEFEDIKEIREVTNE